MIAGRAVSVFCVAACVGFLCSAPAAAMLPEVGLPESSLAPLGCRFTPTKERLLKQYGGSDRSEAAVAAGLKWIVEHRCEDGGWAFDLFSAPKCRGKCTGGGQLDDSRMAATSLALLPLLGAGETHRAGRRRDAVDRGLKGDTSVTGWQLAALKAAHLARLRVPEAVPQKAAAFLDSVQADEGAAYGYVAPGEGPATTAVGLLGRVQFGWQRDRPALGRGIAWLSQRGPSPQNFVRIRRNP